MAFQILRCPYCASEGSLTQENGLWHCAYCGNKCDGERAEEAFAKIQANIGAQIGGALDEALLKAKEEQYYNLRSLLWEKAYAKYTDSAAVLDVCRDIKKLEPHDFLANFFEVANSGTIEDVSNFINNISVEENAIFIDLVIDFMLKSLKSEYVMPLTYLIERAYKGGELKKFEEYSTKLEQEAQKVDSGIYSTLIPRDVFIAYSSKDIDKVIELMTLLEENGLSCFVAMRNLQHGRDAVANYREALRAAIDNSRFIVFVSSKNSRSFSCDALNEELKYVRESELKSAPPEYKNDYVNLPTKYKKMRVEYRLDDTPGATDRFVREFFANLDYCESPEKVLARLADFSLGSAPGSTEEEENPSPVGEAVGGLICTSCGAKNDRGAKFCTTCGKRTASPESLVQKIKPEEKPHTQTVEKPDEKISTEEKNLFKIEGTTLIQYIGKEKKVEIPDFITNIAPSAFIGCDFVTEVIFGSDSLVTNIDANAFCNCTGLVRIDVPKCVATIGAYAFFGCKRLVEVNIPEGVTSIGAHAFEECKSLDGVVLPKSVIYISEDAFKDIPTVYCKGIKPLFGRKKGWDKRWCGSDNNTKVLWGY